MSYKKLWSTCNFEWMGTFAVLLNHEIMTFNSPKLKAWKRRLIVALDPELASEYSGS